MRSVIRSIIRSTTLACVLMLASTARAGRGQGVTFEYDAGVSLTTGVGTRVGIGLDALGVGWFVTDALALSLRASGTSYFQRATMTVNGRSADTFIVKGLSFYGPQAQLYLNDLIFVAGGAGVVIAGPPRLGGLFYRSYDFDVDVSSHVGYGASVRAGLVFFERPAVNLRVSVEGLAGRVESRTWTGLAAQVGLQVL